MLNIVGSKADFASYTLYALTMRNIPEVYHDGINFSRNG